jgi:hypothetical protein
VQLPSDANDQKRMTDQKRGTADQKQRQTTWMTDLTDLTDLTGSNRLRRLNDQSECQLTTKICFFIRWIS